MRPMQHESGSGATPFVDDGASVTASETESTTKKDREKITSFQQPIYWGGHAVIMSKKFEDRIVSASYMTQVCTTCSLHPQLRRHNASSVLTSSLSAWCAGVFAHPHWSGRSAGWWAQNWPADFFAIAKKLEEDQLAQIIWNTQDKARKSRLQMPSATKTSIWGVELRDVEAELSAPNAPIEEIRGSLTHALLAYKVSAEEFISKSKAMPPSEREGTFSYADMQKNMCMPPPSPPTHTALPQAQSETLDKAASPPAGGTSRLPHCAPSSRIAQMPGRNYCDGLRPAASSPGGSSSSSSLLFASEPNFAGSTASQLDTPLQSGSSSSGRKAMSRSTSWFNWAR